MSVTLGARGILGAADSNPTSNRGRSSHACYALRAPWRESAAQTQGRSSHAGNALRSGCCCPINEGRLSRGQPTQPLVGAHCMSGELPTTAVGSRAIGPPSLGCALRGFACARPQGVAETAQRSRLKVEIAPAECSGGASDFQAQLSRAASWGHDHCKRRRSIVRQPINWLRSRHSLQPR